MVKDGFDPLRPAEAFPQAAARTVADGQLRANLRRATGTIRQKRGDVVGELPDWQDLRTSGHAIKDAALAELDRHLLALEENVEARGGRVHWARDAQEARAVILRLIQEAGADRVIKVKSLTTEEMGLNDWLQANGITSVETDLAELIIQLAHERPSHILVPAIHKNRTEIRDLFSREMGLPDLADDPESLTQAARDFLRNRFLETAVGVSGANFAIAETGSLVVVESEGNGRMCLTLPRVLISVVGIEKVLPTFQDLEVFLQLLPRSATGERMNPYTTIFTGVHREDGPQTFHLVLLDHGRSHVMRDPFARSALRCIRCSACLNVCPVYERTGGHAYGSVYPGPIGSVITPYLTDSSEADSLPFASTLCGACADVCPVKIPLPEHLLRLRAHAVARAETTLSGRLALEALGMRALARTFADPRRFSEATRIPQALGQTGLQFAARFPGSPLAGWTRARDLPDPPSESFRAWWRHTHAPTETAPALPVPSETAPSPEPARSGASSGPTLRGRDRHQDRVRPDGSRTTAPPSQTDPGARAVVLARIREALRDRPPVNPIPRSYRVGTQATKDEVLQRLSERLADYGAGVNRAMDLRDGSVILHDLLLRYRAAHVVVPHDLDLPFAWRAACPQVVADGPGMPLTPEALQAMDAAVTGCRLAIAETGTLVLDGGVGQGRRALTLLPDFHICLVAAEQVVADVPTAVRILDPTQRPDDDGCPSVGPLTWISGPSATADIEFRRVQGVHGPRHLEVILYA